MFLEKTYCNFKAIHGYKGYRYELKNFLWEFIVRILGFFTRCFRVFRKSDENSFRNEYVPKGKPKPRTRIARKNRNKAQAPKPCLYKRCKTTPPARVITMYVVHVESTVASQFLLSLCNSLCNLMYK